MKKMGRPKGTNNKDCIYTFRISKDTRKQLDAYCKRKGVTKSQAIRMAIEGLVAGKNKR